MVKNTFDRIIQDIQESYDLALKEFGLSESLRNNIKNTVSDAIINNVDLDDQRIVVTGNPADGFDFYGPFDSVDNAMEFAESGNSLSEEWWCVTLKMEKEKGTPKEEKIKK